MCNKKINFTLQINICTPFLFVNYNVLQLVDFELVIDVHMQHL